MPDTPDEPENNDDDLVPVGYWARLEARLAKMRVVEEAPGEDPDYPF